MRALFDRYYKKYDSWYDSNRFAYLSELEAVKKVLPKNKKGLEIGVGTGRFAAPLGIKYGIDPSKNMLKIAKGRGIAAREGLGEKLPFENGVFDYVTIIITLCFLRDPERVLTESKRVLKKGGKVIVGIIDKDSFLGKYYQKKKSVFYGHANFFSARQAAGLLKNAGFSVLSCYQTLYRLPNRIYTIQEPQRGFGKGGFVVISGGKK